MRSEKIRSAYLSGIVRDGLQTFRYRSSVMRLLGIPETAPLFIRTCLRISPAMKYAQGGYWIPASAVPGYDHRGQKTASSWFSEDEIAGKDAKPPAPADPSHVPGPFPEAKKERTRPGQFALDDDLPANHPPTEVREQPGNRLLKQHQKEKVHPAFLNKGGVVPDRADRELQSHPYGDGFLDRPPARDADLPGRVSGSGDMSVDRSHSAGAGVDEVKMAHVSDRLSDVVMATLSKARLHRSPDLGRIVPPNEGDAGYGSETHIADGQSPHAGGHHVHPVPEQAGAVSPNVILSRIQQVTRRDVAPRLSEDLCERQVYEAQEASAHAAASPGGRRAPEEVSHLRRVVAENNIEAESEVRHSPPAAQPQQVVIVRQQASAVPGTAAFWERSYLSRFRLRSVR